MLVRALQGGGGGSVQENLLWTNSNPSATFDYEHCNFSDSIANYDYLKIECKNAGGTTYYCLVPTSNLINSIYSVAYGNSGTTMAVRSVSRINGSNTTIEINRASQIGGSGSGGSINNIFTPLNVYGVKLPS